ncbi:MAG: RHS repeat-associated core domain-containing protein [Armatimonadota bacterium]
MKGNFKVMNCNIKRWVFDKVRDCFILLAISLIAIGILGQPALADNCKVCTAEPAITFLGNGGGTVTLTYTVGTSGVTLSAGASDYDTCESDLPGLTELCVDVVTFSWSGPGTANGGSFALNTLSTEGRFTVTVTASDITGRANDGSIERTFIINVVPVNQTPVETPVGGSENVGCSSGSGGGCCGGGDFPSPDLRANDLNVNATADIPDGMSCPTNSDMPGNEDVCRPYNIEEHQRPITTSNPSGLEVVYTGADKSQVLEGSALEDGVLLNDGGYLTRTADSSGISTYTVTYPDKSTVTWEFTSLPPTDTWEHRMGPTSVTSPDGKVTTFNRSTDGGLNSVQYPNGDLWRYNHDGQNITRIIPPGTTADESGNVTSGTYIDITYTSNGISSVIEKNAAGATTTDLTTTNYAYQNNRLYTVTKNNKTQALYEYDDDDDTITVTIRSYSTPTEVYSKTVYHYYNSSQTGDGQPAQDQIFVIKKHATDSSLDEVTKYTYYLDSSNNKTYLKSVEDPMGNVTNDTVDAKGRVTEVEDPLGNTTAYEYDSNTGVVTKVTRTTTDLGTFEEHYEYYSLDGNLTSYVKTHESSHPGGLGSYNGNMTLYVRNANTLWMLEAVKVDPVGNRVPTQEEWNAIDPVKTYEYYVSDCADGMAGWLNRVIVPNIDGTTDNVTEYKYGYGVTGKWRESPTQTIYQYWNGSSYQSKISTAIYDDMGRVLATTDANERAIQCTYDSRGRQLKTIYAAGVEKENNYSCCALNWSEDEENHKIYYAYDDAVRVTKAWTDKDYQSVDASLVEYVYDAFGNKTEVKTRSDAETGRTTTYTYDKKNRVKTISYPSSIVGSEEYWYDTLGRVRYKQDSSGKVTAYKYDGLGRLINVYYDYVGKYRSYYSMDPDLDNDIDNNISADVTYTYTIGGVDYGTSRVTSIIDTSGTSSYNYDTQGRVTSYTPPVGLDSGYYVSYGYNNLGQKLYTKITNGTATSYDARYEYYANGWLKSVKNGASDIAAYTYGAVGNRTGITYANGTSTTYTYDSTDPRYLLNTITHKKGANTIAEIDYAAGVRDKTGNPRSMTDWTGTWNYVYDENNRLEFAFSQNPVPDQPCGGEYGYDWVGNRLNPPTVTNHMVYNAADQLTSWPGMYSYSYYNDGSLMEVRNAQGAFVSSYTYNTTGLLNQATYATAQGNHTAVNTWDADNNRVGLTINGKVCSFVYDKTAGIPAVVQEVVNGTPVYYYREPGGELIARTDAVNGIRYYNFDALGSTRLLTDGDGDITDRYAYDAWGTVVAHDRYDGSIDQPYQYVGELGYYTHYQDPGFKLLQLGMRFYDGEAGRFTQMDPIVSGLNWYAYANNDPILNIDPTGLYNYTIPTYDYYDMNCYRDCYGYLRTKDMKSTDIFKKFAVLGSDTLLGCKVGTGPAVMVGEIAIVIDYGYQSDHYITPCCAFCQQRHKNHHDSFDPRSFEHWQRGVEKGIYRQYPIVRWLPYWRNSPYNGEIFGAPPALDW